jgi:HSP20 family molecular chaperone IbpA
MLLASSWQGWRNREYSIINHEGINGSVTLTSRGFCSISVSYKRLPPLRNVRSSLSKHFMQSSVRSSIRRLPSLKFNKLSPKTKVNFSTHTPKMTLLFPRFQEFSPFFHLVDELDRASRTHHRSTRSFAPRFDVKETKEAYELNGELPGIDQSNVNIEWNDESTLTISGHTQKRTESSNAPEVTETAKASEAAETDFVEVDAPTTEEQSSSYQKPTVEDDGAEASSSKAAAEPSEAVTETEKKTVSKADSQSRYWISERSFGKFSRTFHFSSRVEHDAVKASLKNGVLHVFVPKAKLREPTRVVIN